MKRSVLKFLKNVQVKEQGQALVEYALILVLVGVAFGFALSATGPAISNVFANTVYNLLGEAPEVSGVGDSPDDFWLTVTWVATNPPIERALPTRTLAPPTVTFTPGPSPTDAPVIPTNTPIPTRTPPPPNTPVDITHVAPWVDTADHNDWYRLGTDLFLGWSDWVGDYYAGAGLDISGTLFQENKSNVEVYGSHARYVLDFPNSDYDTWKSSTAGPIDAWLTDYYSIRFTRSIFVPPVPGEDLDTATTAIPMNLYVSADDGVRVWLLAAGQSAATCSLATTGVYSGRESTGQNFYGDDSARPTDCLLLDDWNPQGMGSTGSMVRSVMPGVYTLQVDYFENGGNAGLYVDFSTVKNFDDANITGDPRTGITTVGGSPNCNWGTSNTANANSLNMLWDNYVAGSFSRNAMCYLELRGYVYVPDGTTAVPAVSSPQLVFWDVWDFKDQQVGWLEVAEYTPLVDEQYALDRDAIQWYKLPIHAGTSYNYNWTRHVYDLTALDAYDQSGTLTELDFTGKNVTFRFAMANGNSGNTRNWYVDDVQIVSGDYGSYADDLALNTELFLNDPGDANYFITTSQWELTGNNVAPGAFGEYVGCCSWELRPGDKYTEFSESPTSPAPTDPTLPEKNLRLHYVQLIPTLDLLASSVDQEGEIGDPMLTFWTAWDISTYNGIEVQYREEGTDTWLPIPGPGSAEPFGVIIPISNSNTVLANNHTGIQPYDIPLGYIDPSITRIQLRWVLRVHRNGDPRTGWWIDNIKFHREDELRFVDYPFYDDAEVSMMNWLATGTWGRTTDIVPSGLGASVGTPDGIYAYTDSPGGKYSSNSGSATSGQHLRFIYPMDLNNDTPANLALDTHSPFGGNSQGSAAVNPYLTFWHIRNMGDKDHVHVEWRRIGEDESQWKPLWSYMDDMGRDWDAPDPSSRIQLGWEYVEVSLKPILELIVSPGETGYDAVHLAPSDPGYDPLSDVYRDDDIFIRFRLESIGTDNHDGVYIDNIRLEEHTETSHRLWRVGQPGVVDGTNYGLGNGTVFVSSLDESDWWTKWRMGAKWERISWDSRDGLYSFHESTTGQTIQPVYWRGDVQAKTQHDTYQVLEMTRIIDMRATDINFAPTLYFWSRFQVPANSSIRVQVSYEMPEDDPLIQDYHGVTNWSNFICDYRGQCYDHNYGWSQWNELTGFRVDGNTTNIGLGDTYYESFGWQQYQVDLSQGGDYGENFAAAGTDAGRRIRIRFVMNTTPANSGNMRDGWYIDGVSVEPRQDEVIERIATGIFFDEASSMSNWIGEGDWGLDPSISRSVGGGGGGTVSFGAWQEYWWDCGTGKSGENNQYTLYDPCKSGYQAPDGTRYYGGDYRTMASHFFDNNGYDKTPVTRSLFEIDYTMPSGSVPRPGVFNETTTYVGRWTLTTEPIGGGSGIDPGSYSFITVSDDGVRLKCELVDSSGNPVGDCVEGSPYIINSWKNQNATTNMAPIELFEGERYRFTLEYYQYTDTARIALSIGGNTFSFTDSPKYSAAPTAPDVPPMPYANTSLMLDGTLDLAGTIDPYVQFYAYYEIGDGTKMWVDVSNDGGFTWEALTGGQSSDDGETWSDPFSALTGTQMPPSSVWKLIRYPLSSYVGQQIILRFRLERRNVYDQDFKSNNGYYIGVWLADITVAKSS